MKTWQLMATALLLSAGAAQAGTIEVSPSVQTGIGVQNAQQIQMGFGVKQQSGTLIQQQPQYQYIAPSRRGSSSYSYPGNDNIRVNPAVQTGIGVQNGQQIQLGLPDIGRNR